jgi:hypothetical protein
MMRWEKRHNDAIKENFTNRLSRKEVEWPVITQQRK